MDVQTQSKSNISPCRIVTISIIVVSTVLLLLLSTTDTWPTAAVLRHKTVALGSSGSSQPAREQSPARCLQDVVTTVPGGRLGNLAFEYATAGAVAHRFNLRLALADSMLRQLSAAFGGLTALPLSRLLREPPCSHYSLSRALLLGNQSIQGSLASLPDMVHWARSNHLPLVLKKYTMIPELIASSLNQIRQEFNFRPEIQRVADKKLSEAKLDVAELVGCNESQVCTVGVHVRRSDYGEYMREVYHLKEAANAGYYRAAARAMLKYLSSVCAAAAFVVTSDDDKWCRRRLLPALTRSTAEEFPPSKVFLLSSEAAVDDLCLLASCQHNILSYGTFGTMAAILAGGKVILYDVTQHGVRHRPPYFRLIDYIRNWSSLP